MKKTLSHPSWGGDYVEVETAHEDTSDPTVVLTLNLPNSHGIEHFTAYLSSWAAERVGEMLVEAAKATACKRSDAGGTIEGL